MNPNSEIDRNRFFKAVESSYRSLRPFRAMNKALVEEYAGPAYGSESTKRKEKLVNMMQQMVEAYTMSLVANRPRVLVSTKHQQLGYFAKQFQVGVNNLIEEIGLEFTLRRWVLDAFFCVGLTKMHMADSGQVMIEQNLFMDPGKPFCSNVSLDNWVHDCTATNWYEMRYAGDMYRIPFEDLKSNIYDQAVVANLYPSSKYAINDEEMLARITRGYETDPDEFEPHICLGDFWMAREGEIHTYAIDRATECRINNLPPVAVMKWDGPEFGPYKHLGFSDVPENIMPASPASHVADLEILVNNMMSKNARQAERQKEIIGYTPAGAKNAEAAQRTADGEMVEIDDKDSIMPMKFGGVDPGNQAFVLGVIEMFDRMAGNLTAMMGLGAQADTAAQEQLIHAASSKKEASMQYRVVEGAKRIVRDLGHMLWNDKFKQIKGTYSIPGADGYAVDMSWTPDDREGDFLDYNFDIDLYSMPYQSPGQRVQALNSLLTQIYVPLMPLGMQQGMTINMQRLTDNYADMLNLPQLREVIQFMGAVPEQEPGPQGMGGEGQPKPASTTRNYVRRNVPTGGTQQSRSHVMQQTLLNGAVNQDQQSSMARRPA